MKDHKILSTILFLCLGALCLWACFETQSGESLALFGIGAGKRARKQARQMRDIAKSGVKEGRDMYSGLYNKDIGDIDQGLGFLQRMYGQLTNDAGRSYLDTTEGKAFQSNIKRNSRQAKDRLRNDASLMGLSDEAYLAGLGNVNENQALSFRDLITGSDQRRANLNNQRQGILGQILSGNLAQANLKGDAEKMALNYGGMLSGAAQQGYNTSMQQSNANTQALGGLFSAFLGGGGG
jgi:hypothetical protein